MSDSLIGIIFTIVVFAIIIGIHLARRVTEDALQTKKKKL